MLFPTQVTGSLTSTLKPWGLSFALHATLVVALYVIPASTSQRFASAGRTQVIAIEATLAEPTEVSVSAAVLPPTDISHLLEADVLSDVGAERVADDTEPLEIQRHDLPRLAPPPGPVVASDIRANLQRRSVQTPQPTINDQRRPPLPRVSTLPSLPTRPPQSIPRDQFAGLDDESAADLSSNQPPAYPAEAIRRQLEGVVLLQLSIDPTGEVERVDVLKSSGHPILDDAAVDAVSRWRGKPAQRWGRSVASVERLPIRFRL